MSEADDGRSDRWPPNNPGWVYKSYLRRIGRTSKMPCPWCKRTGFVIAYWMYLDYNQGVRNICQECGDAKYQMQEMGRIVGE